MNGRWMQLDLPGFNGKSVVHAKLFFSEYVLREVDKELRLADTNKGKVNPFNVAQLADFIYDIDSKVIIKNRLGSIELMFEAALMYSQLKYSPDERVVRAFDRAETLYELTKNSVDLPAV